MDTPTGFQSISGLVVADFNGDGRPDIAVTDALGKHIVVYLTTSTGTLSAPLPTSIQTSALGAGQLVAGDFNEDGKLDLIVATISGLQSDILFTGNGDGSFTQQAALPGSFGFFNATAVDINHDNHLDLIGGGNGNLYVHLGDGHGTFTLQATPPSTPPDQFFDITAAAFSGNANTGFCTAANNPTNFRTSSILCATGFGTGLFSTPINITTSTVYSMPYSLTSADFNGDGKPDLLSGSADIASILLNNGNGTFQSADAQIVFLNTPPLPATLPAKIGFPLVAAADINADGKPDAIAVDNVTNTVNVFINDGTGKFPQASPDFTSVLPANSTHLALADLNGDGLPDIILTVANQNISVFLSIKPKVQTATTLTASASQLLVGSSLTFTAKVAGTSATPATGSVTLLDGTASLGQQTLDSTGQASFTLSTLTAAVHPLSVTYSGDKNYLSSASSTINQSVTDFQIALAAPAPAVNRGTSAAFQLTLTPVAGLTGSVTLTCSGLPATSTCASTTTTLSGAAQNVTLNVTTTPATNLVKGLRASGIGGSFLLGFLSFLAVIFLPHRRSVPRLTVALIAVAGFNAALGCGSSSQTVSTGSPGSPSGSTPFTVTATITQGTQTINHQVAATLIVN